MKFKFGKQIETESATSNIISRITVRSWNIAKHRQTMHLYWRQIWLCWVILSVIINGVCWISFGVPFLGLGSVDDLLETHSSPRDFPRQIWLLCVKRYGFRGVPQKCMCWCARFWDNRRHLSKTQICPPLSVSNVPVEILVQVLQLKKLQWWP